MSYLADAFEALYCAETDKERDVAIERYAWALRESIVDDVMEALSQLAEEVKDHKTAHVVVLLCESRVTRALAHADRPPPQTLDDYRDTSG